MKNIFVAAFLITCIQNVSALELITNGGFETGDFTGWTATDNTGGGIGEFIPWGIRGPGDGYFGNSSPLSGSFDAGNGFDGDAGLVYELYQDVIIPSSHTAILTTNHRIVYDGLGISSTLDRVFEITIRDLANSILVALFSQNITMNGAPQTDLGWHSQSFDISAFAGQNVRVHLREAIPESYTGPANIEFDDISLQVAPVPEPAVLALMGLGLAGIGYRRHRSKITA